MKRPYPTASIVSAERIVFNIKGNAHRLVVAADFEKSIVWIKWIRTDKAYDKIDVKEIEPRNRVADVLNRKRSLSIDMIRELHARLAISANVLIRPSSGKVA